MAGGPGRENPEARTMAAILRLGSRAGLDCSVSGACACQFAWGFRFPTPCAWRCMPRVTANLTGPCGCSTICYRQPAVYGVVFANSLVVREQIGAGVLNAISLRKRPIADFRTHAPPNRA